jgi:hypothetical protein
LLTVVVALVLTGGLLATVTLLADGAGVGSLLAVMATVLVVTIETAGGLLAAGATVALLMAAAAATIFFSSSETTASTEGSLLNVAVEGVSLLALTAVVATLSLVTTVVTTGLGGSSLPVENLIALLIMAP